MPKKMEDLNGSNIFTDLLDMVELIRITNPLTSHAI
jgi:hypothetical protein